MITVRASAAGSRLDRFLVDHVTDLSRARLQQLILDADVMVNGQPSRPSRALREGDEVRVHIPAPATTVLPQPEDIPLSVVYEDEDLMVLDKPAGLVVHPSETVSTGTLVNALLARGGPLSTLGGVERPGILHRLDKGTSGLLLVAKHDEAHAVLADSLRERRIHRQYRAVAWGRFPAERGRINAEIGRDERRRMRMAVRAKGGRQATTHFEVQRLFRWATDLSLTLETGRTHQIRVHLSHRRHPVFGDPAYGGRRIPASLAPRDAREARAILDEFKRPALHAARLAFDHPRTGEPMSFDAPLPEDFAWLLARLTES